MKRLIQLLIGLACVVYANAQQPDFTSSIPQSERYVSEFMDAHQVPGMQIAVSHKNKLVWSDSFGYSNLELEIPVTKPSKFRIASVSKPVTAVLTAYLCQIGILDIDASVNDYFRELSNGRWDFTVRQLMSHAAGVRHYRPSDVNQAKYHSSIADGFHIIVNDSLLYEPGSRFSYSSYGYNIIAGYIECVTAQPFGDLVMDSLFIPLQMVHSAIDHPYEIIPNRTSGYQLSEEGEVINAAFFDNRYKIPAGGMLSTAEDLVLFGNALLYGDYLSTESKELLFTPFVYRDEKESDTGFGWVTTVDEQGNKLYGHLGGITGGCAAIMIYPDKELVIVWLGNLDADWSDIPTKTVANYFLEAIK